MPFYTYLTHQSNPGTGRYLITAITERAATGWYQFQGRPEWDLKRLTDEWYTYTSDTNITKSASDGVVITRIADGLDTAGRSWVTFQNKRSN